MKGNIVHRNTLLTNEVSLEGYWRAKLMSDGQNGKVLNWWPKQRKTQ